jgi:hypothetical protein
MQKVRVDMTIERKLIMLLVMNDDFISKLRPILNPDDLSTSYAKEVATWCVEFYDNFDKAPGPAIQDIFVSKREFIPEDDTIKAIGEFLSKTLVEYDPDNFTNIPFYIDSSEKYLRRNNILRLNERVAGYVDVGEIDKAEHLIGSYHRIEVPSNQGISILEDAEAIRSAFSTEQELAFRFPGAIGTVVGNVYLGDLIGWTAPFKTGKTWALLYTAEQAMLAGKRVLFISLEMRRDQLIRRAWQSLNGRPVLSGSYKLPAFVRDGDEGMWTKTINTVHREGINISEIEAFQKSTSCITRRGDVRYMCLPSKTTTVNDLEIILDNLMYYENYNADVLIVDYADILGATKTFKGGEYRHLMDDIWSNLRRVAQDRNITVATASQVNRGGLDAETLKAENLAEDIRKAGHVAKLIGLSRTTIDRDAMGARVKMLYERDEQETYEGAYVLQQLAFGRFCVDSRLTSEIDS